jgi:Flp pilus assembly protein TadB
MALSNDFLARDVGDRDGAGMGVETVLVAAAAAAGVARAVAYYAYLRRHAAFLAVVREMHAGAPVPADLAAALAPVSPGRR